MEHAEISHAPPRNRDGSARKHRLCRAALPLDLRIERAQLDLGFLHATDEVDVGSTLTLAASQVGLTLGEASSEETDTLWELAEEGLPVLVQWDEDEFLILARTPGLDRLELQHINEEGLGLTERMSARKWASRLRKVSDARYFVVRRELECDALSQAPMHGNERTGKTKALTPGRRFFQLLRLDARDIFTVSLFGLIAGALGLATPLAVESLVNVVSWGIYLQPLLVLALILLISLGISAALTVLQTIVVEIIQRRQLVRIVSDLAHRFPVARRDYFESKYPRELANRVFDVMTIQKATAILLMDGVSIVLTAFLGMLLLAFYHPFLLGFDLVLLLCMTVVTFLLGRGGVRTAIRESKTKYRIVHWLQDVLDSPGAFRANGGRAFSVDRANVLAADYVHARKQQFQVVLRQVIFAIGLQVVASTVLLGLGGYLVIQGQLTLGQLVASELVVAVVVGAFSKAGKSLEKYYDLMAGIEKVGQLLDIPVDPHAYVSVASGKALTVGWDDLRLNSKGGTVRANAIDAGAKVGLLDNGSAGELLEAIAGLRSPQAGHVEVDDIEAPELVLGSQGTAVGWAAQAEVFYGSIHDNVSMGRLGVGRERIREVLELVGSWDTISRLEDGLDTTLQTGGSPFSRSQIAKLMLARALAGQPGLLLVSGALDELSEEDQKDIVGRLLELPATTVVVASKNKYLLDSLPAQLELSS